VVNPRKELSLQPGSASPARGTGPNGRDMGAAIPAGASIAGAPISPSTQTNFMFTVGGPEIYAYKYKVNDGPWEDEIAVSGTQTTNRVVPSIQLTNLPDGTYTVYLIAKNSAGVWQAEDQATSSNTFVVNTIGGPLVINGSDAAEYYYLWRDAAHGTIQIDE